MGTLVKQNGKSRWEFKGGISNTNTKKLYLPNALRDNQHIISKKKNSSPPYLLYQNKCQRTDKSMLVVTKSMNDFSNKFI